MLSARCKTALVADPGRDSAAGTCCPVRAAAVLAEQACVVGRLGPHTNCLLLKGQVPEYIVTPRGPGTRFLGDLASLLGPCYGHLL